MKELMVAMQPLSMTLGDVYDLDLKKNEQAIKEVVLQAQGEVSVSQAVC